jgi:hypothetical protein
MQRGVQGSIQRRIQGFIQGLIQGFCEVLFTTISRRFGRCEGLFGDLLLHLLLKLREKAIEPFEPSAHLLSRSK